MKEQFPAKGGFNPKDFESKWKKQWEENGIYKTPEIKKGDDKAYILDMYPYPSGSGLHVGHPKGYLGSDIVARFMRMQGKKVMHPMGFDSFGLPAENYAIKSGVHPQKTTDDAIEMFKSQIENIGLSYDWSRELSSHRPEYYKWTQWLFLQFYKKGIAYKKNAPVNWCPKDQTVLANEQVIDGKCERCDSEVIQKDMEQWFFKITDYADRLIEGLDRIDWPESTKLGQKNWIGRSEGARIKFEVRSEKLEGKDEKRRTKNEVKNVFENVNFDFSKASSDVKEKNIKALGLVVVRNNKGEVLILKRAEENQKDSWELPGGSIDISDIQNETARELKEETGISSDLNFEFSYDGYNPEFDKTYRYFIYSCNVDEINIKLSDEHSEFKVITPAEAAELLFWEGHKQAVLHRSSQDFIEVFTTRADTIYSGAFIVVAPEHKWLQDQKSSIINFAEVEKYITEAKSKTDLERQQQKDKSGVRIEGITAINPSNQKQIPIYVGDFVLGGYGTGAVFGDVHDERDFEFVKNFNIDAKPSIVPENPEQAEKVKNLEVCFTDYGILIDSDEFTGMKSEEAIGKIIDKLEKEGKAKRQVNYRLRDWLVSRQRYWGCPIPIVYSEEMKKEDIGFIPKKSLNILMLHGRGSDSQGGFKPWLKKELENVGHKVFAPDLPNSETPNYSEWIKYIEKNYSDILKSDNLVIVGHSLGGSVALKLAEKYKIAKIVGVATPPACDKEFNDNYFNAPNFANEKMESLYKFFVDAGEFNVESIKSNVNELVFINSTNDKSVTQELQKIIKEKFNDSAKFIDLENRGHFSSKDNCYTLSEALFQINVKGNSDQPGVFPIPESDLPVLIPHDVDFKPTGESPLASSKEFIQRAEEKYGKGWRYEVDTMDTFVDSSWYFFRFADVHNEKEFASSEKMNAWLPVDLYVGGAEHTVLHLMYARFFTKVLFDMGMVDFDEPFQKLRHQGMIAGPDGRKMSKRWGNIINPDDEIEKYGADTLRIYEMFMGQFKDGLPWSTETEIGVFRFITKIWALQDKVNKESKSQTQEIWINKLIKKVQEDIVDMSFNTAVAKMMEFVNFLVKEESINQSVWEKFLLVVAPFGPYVTEELWSKLGNEFSIHNQPWPKYEEALTKDSVVKIAVQVNGKIRGTVEIDAGSEQDVVYAKALEDAIVKKYVVGDPKKIIFVKDRILNIVV